MSDFVPTHRITHTRPDGTRDVYEVAEFNGCLYTQGEWDHAENADWTIDEDRRVWFQGQAAPSCGAVTVEQL